MTTSRTATAKKVAKSSLSARVPPGGEVAKTGAGIARRIEAQIISDGWPVGQWLGSEPDLVEQYGVSRAAFREAVRLLEFGGVARMRTGPGGGLIVTAPDASVVTRAAASFLDYQHVKGRNLFNARSALELKCIELIGGKMTPEQCDHLRSVVEAESTYTTAEIAENSDRFHLVLAELAGDPAIELFLRVLTELSGGHALPAAYVTLENGNNDVQRTCREHKRIANALMSGETEKASTLMLRHLKWVSDGVATFEANAER
jgi:DNA-binding FadR family transcriptional regulator